MINNLTQKYATVMQLPIKSSLIWKLFPKYQKQANMLGLLNTNLNQVLLLLSPSFVISYIPSFLTEQTTTYYLLTIYYLLLLTEQTTQRYFKLLVSY